MTRDQNMRISDELGLLPACNFDFATPTGFFLIMEEGPKQKWWIVFIYYLHRQLVLPEHDKTIPIYFINPSSRMAEALIQFLEERSKEWGLKEKKK